jgi:CHAD domain-containing protein
MREATMDELIDRIDEAETENYELRTKLRRVTVVIENFTEYYMIKDSTSKESKALLDILAELKDE